MNTSIELGQALRNLPQEAPAHALWPELKSQLPKKPVWPKWFLATAASAAVLVFLLQFKGAYMTDTQNPGSQIAEASGLTGIMDQSAQLENIYYNAQDDGISSAAVIAANLGIEEQLDVIDSQLATPMEPAEALRLWQQRVDLLDQGIALNRTNAEYNRSNRSFDLAMASLN
jgi:hypothetical protein